MAPLHQPTPSQTPKKVLLVARVLMAGFFLISGALKMVDLQRFHDAVINYHLVDGPLAEWVALSVPTAEVVLGVLLLFNLFPLGTLFSLIAMMITFTVAIGMAWSRDLDINCGCFGKLSDQSMDYPLSIALNSGIIVVLGIFFALALRKPKVMNKHGYTLPKNLLYEKGRRRA
ncbi:DoxX family protein [Sulfuriroseicoccus oceanibius]|uniref:DoxX family protein n=1 Tax=Sulfuriroseicoccus oceanibius TaxID=2707525 RepID=A0A6B3L1F2_9BACT|nr:DoxX family protein [Sulfuriroseicoccus oceanibius]QQL43868.1 DoxX family protein [Sulfuriroseicoccus oceanibius]